jgi:hypothetical protein
LHNFQSIHAFPERYLVACCRSQWSLSPWSHYQISKQSDRIWYKICTLVQCCIHVHKEVHKIAGLLLIMDPPNFLTPDRIANILFNCHWIARHHE